MCDGAGIPIGVILAGRTGMICRCWNRRWIRAARFGFFLPEQIEVSLDAGYDAARARELLQVRNCTARISPKGTYVEINHTRRWMTGRVNSWHTRGFSLLQVMLDRTARVQEVFTKLANAVIVLRRLLKNAWTTHRWDGRLSSSSDGETR